MEVVMNYRNILLSVVIILLSGYAPAALAMDKPNPNLGWALIHACFNGKTKIAASLIQQGADVNVKDCNNHTPLHFACKQGNLQLVKLLCARCADVNAQGITKSTPLHFAAINNHHEIIEFLVNEPVNANVHAQDQFKTTALEYACQKGNLKTVMLLVDHGADVNAESDDKITPLLIACKHGHPNVVEYLVKNKADIHAGNSHNSTALHFACYYGHLKIVKILLVNGAKINAQNINGVTPLHFAVFCEKLIQTPEKKLDLVKTLLTNGADTTLKIKIGISALDLAYDTGIDNLINLFATEETPIITDEQANENMRAFFAELDEEAKRKEEQAAHKKAKNQRKRANKKARNADANQAAGQINKEEETEFAPKEIVPAEQEVAINPIETVTQPTADNPGQAVNVPSTPSQPVPAPIATPTLPASTQPLSIAPAKKKAKKKANKGNKTAQATQPANTNQVYTVGSDGKLKWPKSLNKDQQSLLLTQVKQLRLWPNHGLDVKPLKGKAGSFRLRVGGHRVIFSVDEANHTITIHDIAIRKNVYKNM